MLLNFLKQNQINDFILCDFGCGFGRDQGKFFMINFECLFYGMEISKEMIEDLKKDLEINLICLQ